MPLAFSTYAYGFDFKPIKTITKAEFIQIVDRIGYEFGEGWEFQPERKIEGGIIVTKWPGKTPTMYKSMRLFYNNTNDNGKWSWPRIEIDFRSKWEHSQEIVWRSLSPKKTEDWCETVLKAFHMAPPWKLEELKIIAGVLNESGVATRKMPKKSDLVPK